MILALVAISGCGQQPFADRATNPVIEGYVSKDLIGNSDVLGTLSTSADKRVVLVSMKQGQHEGHFCAEPMPDALTSAISSLKLSGQWDAARKAEVERLISTSASPFFIRSQSVELFRDAVFSLCNAYIIDALNKEDYSKKFDAALEMAGKLLLAEMAYLPKQNPQFNPPQIPPKSTTAGTSASTQLQTQKNKLSADRSQEQR